jgi:hypothetical protein
MKVFTMHNEQSSAATSPSEPPYKVELSEADYLAREVEDAKQALSHALADLKNGISQSADLRRWVKHYPWAALGAATVAGFAAGAAVAPATGETVSEKLSRLKSNGHESSPAEAERPPEKPSAERSSVKTSLMDSLFDLAKTLIQTVLIATLRGQGGANAGAENTTAVAAADPWRARAG